MPSDTDVGAIVRELSVYVILVLAAAVPHASYLLGIGPATAASLLVAVALFAGTVWALAPAERRPVAVVAGAVAVVVAGWAVPVFAARAVRPDATLPLSVLLAGGVLVATVAVIRLTTFRRVADRAA